MVAIEGLFYKNIYGYWSIIYTVVFIIISIGLYMMKSWAAITGFIFCSIFLILSLIFNRGENIAMASMAIFYLLAFRATSTYL